LLAAREYEVKIAIYDLSGRKVRDLVHRKQQAGTYTVQWDAKMNTGRLVGAGSFILRMQAGNLSAMKKITVLR
jgi:flagellar hook assembly protein FlgD